MATTGFSATLTPLRLTLSGPDGENVALVFGRFGANAKQLAGYLTDGGLWQDAADDVYDVLNSAMTTVFAQGGAYAGSQVWAPNKPAYRRKKEIHRGHDRVGEDSGALKRSLTSDDASGAIRRDSRDGIIFGSSLPYAEEFDEGSGPRSFLYFGTTFNLTGTPPRPLFNFGPASSVTRDAAKRVQAAFVWKSRGLL